MKINKNIDLRELIFQQISQETIFRYYYPYNFTLNSRCLSPFKNEREPSMIIGTKSKNGDIIFNCFNSANKGDCINFVMQLYNLSYFDALQKIYEDLILKNEIKEKIDFSLVSKPISVKKYSEIKISVKPFTKEELNYWNYYHQSISDLRDENIYSPKSIWINKKKLFIKDTELVFCYYYPEIDRWKIYKPFGNKKDKWISNIPLTTMEGLKNLNIDKIALINKSKKDYMVVKKVYPFSCSVQNESVSSFSQKNVEIIKNNSLSQYLLFDSDEVGVTNSIEITKLYDLKYCNVPKIYLKEGIKDWALFGAKYGLNAIENYFKSKNII